LAQRLVVVGSNGHYPRCLAAQLSVASLEHVSVGATVQPDASPCIAFLCLLAAGGAVAIFWPFLRQGGTARSRILVADFLGVVTGVTARRLCLLHERLAPSCPGGDRQRKRDHRLPPRAPMSPSPWIAALPGRGLGRVPHAQGIAPVLFSRDLPSADGLPHAPVSG